MEKRNFTNKIIPKTPKKKIVEKKNVELAEILQEVERFYKNISILQILKIETRSYMSLWKDMRYQNVMNL